MTIEEEQIAPDQRRLNLLSIWLGAFFALCGFAIFLAFVGFVFFSVSRIGVDHLNGDQRYILRFFLKRGGVWAVLSAFLSLTVLAQVASNAVKRRVLANKNSMRTSWLYTFVALWLSLSIGFVGTLIADSNRNIVDFHYALNFDKIFGPIFIIGLLSAVLSVFFGKLLDLSFRGLSTAPGFGVPRD